MLNSFFSELSVSQNEKKASSPKKQFSTEMYDMISKRQALKTSVALMKDHVNKDVFFEAIVPLSLQVQKKIADTHYMQCETSGTRIVFYDLLVLEQTTFMESPSKRFRNL